MICKTCGGSFRAEPQPPGGRGRAQSVAQGGPALARRLIRRHYSHYVQPAIVRGLFWIYKC